MFEFYFPSVIMQQQHLPNLLSGGVVPLLAEEDLQVGELVGAAAAVAGAPGDDHPDDGVVVALQGEVVQLQRHHRLELLADGVEGHLLVKEEKRREEKLNVL